MYSDYRRNRAPTISAIISLYNKGPYIARALNSTLAQTFQNFEVIAVDNGSNDDRAEIARGLDDPGNRLIRQGNGIQINYRKPDALLRYHSISSWRSNV